MRDGDGATQKPQVRSSHATMFAAQASDNLSLAKEVKRLLEENKRLRAALQGMIDHSDIVADIAVLYSHSVYGADHQCRECEAARAILGAREAARAALEGTP